MNRVLVSLLLCWGGQLAACSTAELSVPFQPSIAPTLPIETLAYPDFLADPKTAETYRQSGLAAREQDDLSSAIAQFKTAVALAPRHVPGYVLLGWTQHLAGDHEAAIATLTQALTLNPEQVQTLNALGITYLVKGDLEAAIATHVQAKTLQPDNEIAYYNLSLAYQRLPDLSAAIHHAERAAELEPYNPHPWVALALAHWSQQDTEAALQAYDQALQLDGRYYDAYHLEHLLKAGFSAEQIETVDEIRTEFL